MAKKLSEANGVILKSKDHKLNKIIIGCGILLVCSFCLGISIVGILVYSTFGGIISTFGEASSSVHKLCTIASSDLKNFYDKNTTSRFKDFETFLDFQTYFNQNKEIILDCSSFNKDSYLLSTFNGVQASYSQVYGETPGDAIVITYPSKSKKVVVILVKENGAWKFESVMVDDRIY